MPAWGTALAGVVFGFLTIGVLAATVWGVVFLFHDRTKFKNTHRETSLSLQRAAAIAKKSHVDLYGERPPDLDTGRFDVPPDLPPPRGSA